MRRSFIVLFSDEKREKKKSYLMILLFQSSFRLSEKNEKDKKRKVLTPVSATPTHMLRICVNPPTMRVVEGADPYKIKPQYSQKKKQKIYTSFRQRTYSTHARHALSAGVQAMRARICSASSCDMFARVV